MDRSQFHRTLYIFACLNPICSQTSKGWLCVRTQHMDTPNHHYNEKDSSSFQISSSSLITSKTLKKKNENGDHKKPAKVKSAHASKSIGIQNWCTGSDDWGDNDESSVSVPMAMVKMDAESFQSEEEANDEANGNIISINRLDNIKTDINGQEMSMHHNEEEDDDSNSMDNELICSLYQMDMNSLSQLAEDPNANCAAAAVIMPMAGSAAMGKDGNYSCSGATATICAEIEGTESEMVLVEEPPQRPERDLAAMMRQPISSALMTSLKKLTAVRLKSFFIAVEVENRSAMSQDCENYDSGNLSTAHIRELYQEYKKRDEILTSYSPHGGQQKGIAGASSDDQEMYENTLPAHGDLMFHNFLRTLQHNPGQVIRYKCYKSINRFPFYSLIIIKCEKKEISFLK